MLTPEQKKEIATFHKILIDLVEGVKTSSNSSHTKQLNKKIQQLINSDSDSDSFIQDWYFNNNKKLRNDDTRVANCLELLGELLKGKGAINGKKTSGLKENTTTLYNKVLEKNSSFIKEIFNGKNGVSVQLIGNVISPPSEEESEDYSYNVTLTEVPNEEEEVSELTSEHSSIINSPSTELYLGFSQEENEETVHTTTQVEPSYLSTLWQNSQEIERLQQTLIGQRAHYTFLLSQKERELRELLEFKEKSEQQVKEEKNRLEQHYHFALSQKTQEVEKLKQTLSAQEEFNTVLQDQREIELIQLKEILEKQAEEIAALLENQQTTQLQTNAAKEAITQLENQLAKQKESHKEELKSIENGLNIKILQLERIIEDKKHKLTAFSAAHQEEIQELEGDLARKKQIYTNDLSKKTEEIRSLQNTLASSETKASETIASLQKELKQQQTNLFNFQLEKEQEIKDLHQIFEEEKQNYSAEIQKKHEEIQSLQNTLTASELEFENKINLLQEELDKQIQKYTNEITKKEEEISSLQELFANRTQELNQNILNLQNQLTAQQQSVTNEESQQTYDSMEPSIEIDTAMTEENYDLPQIDPITPEPITENQNNGGALNEKIESLQNELTALQEAYAEQHLNLENTMNQLERKKSQCKKVLEKLKKQKIHYENQLAKKNTETQPKNISMSDAGMSQIIKTMVAAELKKRNEAQLKEMQELKDTIAAQAELKKRNEAQLKEMQELKDTIAAQAAKIISLEKNQAPNQLSRKSTIKFISTTPETYFYKNLGGKRKTTEKEKDTDTDTDTDTDIVRPSSPSNNN